MMQPLLINKSKSEILIRDFYRVTAPGCYGSIVYRLKPNAYKFIDLQKFEQLSRDMFTQVEIRICCQGEFIALSLLEFEGCDGIVIHSDKSNKLAAKFVEKGKVYGYEWLKNWIPALGVQERIDYILYNSGTEPVAKPCTSDPVPVQVSGIEPVAKPCTSDPVPVHVSVRS